MTELAYWRIVTTIFWGVLIFAISSVVQVVSVIVWLKYQARPLSELQNALYDGNSLAIATISSMLVGLLAIYVVIKFKKHSDVVDYLAIQAIPLKALLPWLMGLAALLFFSDYVLSLNPGNQNESFMASIAQSANPKWLLWLAVILAAPIFEEVFFRGFLFKGLRHSFLGVSGTILMTSACWALIHLQYDYMYIAVIFVLGLYFAWARYKTGSILLPLAMHMLYNLVAMLQISFAS